MDGTAVDEDQPSVLSRSIGVVVGRDVAAGIFLVDIRRLELTISNNCVAMAAAIVDPSDGEP